jgi:hypothetical protein
VAILFEQRIDGVVQAFSGSFQIPPVSVVVMRLLAFLTLSICVFAQADKARLIGTVADSTGAIIPSAAITIKDNKTGLERQASSDDRGFFAITNLSPSTYTVIAKSSGLGPMEYKEIHLSVGQERTLNIVLQPASVTTEAVKSQRFWRVLVPL